MGLLRIVIAGLLLLLVWRAVGAVRDWWGERRLADESGEEQEPNPLRPCRRCGTYLPQQGLDHHGLCARCRDGDNV